MKKIVTKIIRGFARNSNLLRIFNIIYEKSTPKICMVLEKYIAAPDYDFDWIIKLENGKKIIYPFKKGDPYLSFHFPLSYKRNDYLLRKIEIIIDSLYPSEVIYFDIGANLGLRSLYYAAMGREIYMFEPNTMLGVYTNRLVERNNFQNITIVNKLIGRYDDAIHDFHISTSSYCSSVYSDGLSGDTIETVINLPSISIDSFAKKFNLLKRVKIIKIDVEGFELEVLKGGFTLFSSENIVLLIEVIPTSKFKYDVFSYLKNIGHLIFVVDSNYGKLKEIHTGFHDNSIDYLITNNLSLINKFTELNIIER